MQSYFEAHGRDSVYNYNLENTEEAWVQHEHSQLVDALIIEESLIVEESSSTALLVDALIVEELSSTTLCTLVAYYRVITG